MNDRINPEFDWYQDITPNHMFSLYEYPNIGKAGLPLHKQYVEQLELKEVIMI